MTPNRWKVEARVTRGAGDVDAVMPQVITEGCARWVFVCFDRDDHLRWCGARHETEGAAKDHAGLLNGGIRGART